MKDSNIIAAMKGRRVFERFGFNLPKREKKALGTRKLNEFTEWGYVSKCSDWKTKNGGVGLTGYVLEKDLKTFLKDTIVKAG